MYCNFVFKKDTANNFKDNSGFYGKMSDFSIDYILNRAGDKFGGCKSFPMCDRISPLVENFENYETVDDKDKAHYRMPMFDWLQYTRYRPPKIQRPFRSGPVKRTPGRLPRVPFTPGQLNALENAYKTSTYLSSEDANKLADQLDLTNTRVKIWFQNRRARERREKRERGENADISNFSTSPSPDREILSID